MKLKAYQNHLDHAILIPPPPVRESAQTQSGHRHKEGCGGWPSEVGGDASCGDADEPSTANYLVLDEPPRARAAGGGGWGGVKERSAEVPEGWLRELGQMRQRGLVSPSISYKSAHTGYSSMSMPHVVTISSCACCMDSFLVRMRACPTFCSLHVRNLGKIVSEMHAPVQVGHFALIIRFTCIQQC